MEILVILALVIILLMALVIAGFVFYFRPAIIPKNQKTKKHKAMKTRKEIQLIAEISSKQHNDIPLNNEEMEYMFKTTKDSKYFVPKQKIGF